MYPSRQTLDTINNRRTRKPNSFWDSTSAAFDYFRLAETTGARDAYRFRRIDESSLDMVSPDEYLGSGSMIIDNYDERVQEHNANLHPNDLPQPTIADIDRDYLQNVKDAKEKLDTVVSRPDDGEFLIGDRPEDYQDVGVSVGQMVGVFGAAITDPINIMAAPTGIGIASAGLRTAAMAGRNVKKVRNILQSPVKTAATKVATGAVSEGAVGGIAETVIGVMTAQQRKDILGFTTDMTPEEIDKQISSENTQRAIIGLVAGAVIGGATSMIPGAVLTKKQYDEIYKRAFPKGSKYHQMADDVQKAWNDLPVEPEVKYSKFSDLDLETSSADDIFRSMAVPNRAEVRVHDSLLNTRAAKAAFIQRELMTPELDNAITDIVRWQASHKFRRDTTTGQFIKKGRLTKPEASVALVRKELEKLFPDNKTEIEDVLKMSNYTSGGRDAVDQFVRSEDFRSMMSDGIPPVREARLLEPVEDIDAFTDNVLKGQVDDDLVIQIDEIRKARKDLDLCGFAEAA